MDRFTDTATLSRRALLTSALAALARPDLAEAATTPAPPPAMPFLMPLADDPDCVALCIPTTRITHAYLYMRADGRTLHAERLDRERCNDGTGWRESLPGEWDGRIIGRVVTKLYRDRGDWWEVGRAALCG